MGGLGRLGHFVRERQLRTKGILDFRIRGMVMIFCIIACIDIRVGYNHNAVIQSSTLSARWRQFSLVSFAVTVFFFWCCCWFVFLLVIGSGSVIIQGRCLCFFILGHGGGKS